jgi:hypothetical protein
MQVDTGRWKTLAAASARLELEADVSVTSVASPGRLIALERVRRGLSVEQLSLLTKIPRAQLEALESDRFDQLAGPVFVKGFLRCCARALRIEEDLVFGMLYEQERESIRRRRRRQAQAGSNDHPSILPALASIPKAAAAPAITPKVRTHNNLSAPAAARVDVEESFAQASQSGTRAAAKSTQSSSSSSRLPRLSVGTREVIGQSLAPSTSGISGSSLTAGWNAWGDRAPVVSSQAAVRGDRSWNLGKMLDRVPGQESLAELAELGRTFVSRAFPARLAMWAAVSLLVAAIVFIAFNLASSHQTIELMRS